MFFYIVTLDEECGAKYFKLRSMKSNLTRVQALEEIQKISSIRVNIDDILEVTPVNPIKWARF